MNIMTHPGNELFKEENIMVDEQKLRTLVPNLEMITYNDL